MTTTTELLATVTETYRAAVESGETRAQAAESAWRAVRGLTGYRHLRAQSGIEALARNTSARRSYRSPLGEVLAFAGHVPGHLGSDYGQHAAAWPRTVSSLVEAEHRANALLDHLDALAGIAPAEAA